MAAPRISIREAIASVRRARGESLTELAGADLAALCRDTQVLLAEVQGFQLDTTVAADKSHVARREGAASTESWMAQTTGVSYREAAKDLRLAKALDTTAPLAREALSRPGMSKDKAHIIAGAMDKLPRRLSPAQRTTIEADLVDKGTKISFEDLRRAAKRAVEVIDPAWADRLEGDQLNREEIAARKAATLWMSPPDEVGMVEGGFKLPVLAAGMLQTAVEAYASPRKDCGDTREDLAHLSYPQKLGRGFVQIIEHLPTDKFPRHGRMAATIIVSVAHDQLVSGISAASLSTGERISINAVRRLACDADIIPVVLGGKSVTLDFGTRRRYFSDYQKLSIARRDTGCAFPGCHAPAAWTEVHHINAWALGGSTDIKDGVLLCSRHHHTIHQEEWSIRSGADGHPDFIPPSHLDPQRTPRRNTHWHATRKVTA